MAKLNVGDVCPQCKQGLLERTEVGLDCSECNFALELAAVVAANEKNETETEEYKYRVASVKIRIETPEAGEEFLRGLILARQNNNSQLFVELIEGINSLLEPWRAARLKDEMAARTRAGMA